MSADHELGRLEAERVHLYQKLADLTGKYKETSTDLKVRIYEVEQRISAIYRGER